MICEDKKITIGHAQASIPVPLVGAVIGGVAGLFMGAICDVPESSSADHLLIG